MRFCFTASYYESTLQEVPALRGTHWKATHVSLLTMTLVPAKMCVCVRAALNAYLVLFTAIGFVPHCCELSSR